MSQLRAIPGPEPSYNFCTFRLFGLVAEPSNP